MRRKKLRGLAQALFYLAGFAVGVIAGWYISDQMLNAIRDFLTFHYTVELSTGELEAIRKMYATAESFVVAKASIVEGVPQFVEGNTLEDLFSRGIAKVCEAEEWGDEDPCKDPPYCWICFSENYRDKVKSCQERGSFEPGDDYTGSCSGREFVKSCQWEDGVVKSAKKEIAEIISGIQAVPSNGSGGEIGEGVIAYLEKRGVTTTPTFTGIAPEGGGGVCYALGWKISTSFGTKLPLSIDVEASKILDDLPCIPPEKVLSAVYVELEKWVENGFKEGNSIRWSCGGSSSTDTADYVLLEGKASSVIDLSDRLGNTYYFCDITFRVKSTVALIPEMCTSCFKGEWFVEGDENYYYESCKTPNPLNPEMGCCCGDDPHEAPGSCMHVEGIPNFWIDQTIDQTGAGGSNYCDHNGDGSEDKYCCSELENLNPKGACLIYSDNGYECHDIGKVVESPGSSCRMRCGFDSNTERAEWFKLEEGSECNYGVECASGMCRGSSLGGSSGVCVGVREDACSFYERVSIGTDEDGELPSRVVIPSGLSPDALKYENCKEENEKWGVAAEDDELPEGMKVGGPWWCSCYTEESCYSNGWKVEPVLVGRVVSHEGYVLDTPTTGAGEFLELDVKLRLHRSFSPDNPDQEASVDVAPRRIKLRFWLEKEAPWGITFEKTEWCSVNEYPFTVKDGWKSNAITFDLINSQECQQVIQQVMGTGGASATGKIRAVDLGVESSDGVISKVELLYRLQFPFDNTVSSNVVCYEDEEGNAKITISAEIPSPKKRVVTGELPSPVTARDAFDPLHYVPVFVVTEIGGGNYQPTQLSTDTRTGMESTLVRSVDITQDGNWKTVDVGDGEIFEINNEFEDVGVDLSDYYIPKVYDPRYIDVYLMFVPDEDPTTGKRIRGQWGTSQLKYFVYLGNVEMDDCFCKALGGEWDELASKCTFT